MFIPSRFLAMGLQVTIIINYDDSGCGAGGSMV
jgi:hypothetical protein